jgi:hypothetical protein
MISLHGARIWQIATITVGTLVVAVLASGAIYLAATNSGLNSELAAARTDTMAATANGNSLYEQLVAEGIKPAAEKPAKVVTGEPGMPGMDGAPGRPPTAAEVASSVTAYCTIRLDCSGAAGAVGPASLVPGPKGDTGTAGADSTVPGDRGATGADSTVPGPTGLTGTGIASIACQTDGYWAFTLTQPDGTTTTQTVAGPCRVDPIIPTPTQGVTP